jgi:hypothetical protein
MAPADVLLLSGWDSYYVIIGSSAAALTGLNFVVVALGAESRTMTRTADLAAFGTPTIVHFCAALLVSAILSAPWRSAAALAACIGACGIAGLVYVVRAMLIVRRGTGYKPVFEDILWHFVLPLTAYTSLLVASAMFTGYMDAALFTIAPAVLLLMLIGIHNAWDTATWMTYFTKRQQGGERAAAEGSSPNEPGASAGVSSRDTSSSRTG